MLTNHQDAPSAWVRRFVPLIRRGGAVLDLAAGAGRHTRLLIDMGFAVTAVDRNVESLRLLAGPRCAVRELDLETGMLEMGILGPLGGEYDGIIVTNYLHRPLLPAIGQALAAGGVLIYETFAAGNERFGRPKSADFLLRPGELLAAFAALSVVAFEEGEVGAPRPAVIQRIAARAGPLGHLPEPACSPASTNDKTRSQPVRRERGMRERVLGTLTIGQAPRPDVVPIIDRHVPAEIRRIHRGVLDGLSRAAIDARYRPLPGEPVLVTRLAEGGTVELSRRRMRDGVQQALADLEAEGCDVILLLCTGSFDGLECAKAWLVEPDHIIPAVVAGLVERRRLGVIVPIASQIASERGKWRPLAQDPIFAAASPYDAEPEAVAVAGADLKARGAEAILLDCIGFTERHRAALGTLDLPVILSNAVAAKAVGELLGM